LRILHYPANYPDPQYGQPFNMIFVAEHVRAAAVLHDNVVLYVSPMVSRSGEVEVARTNEEGVRVIRIHTPHSNSEIQSRVQVYVTVFAELLRLVTSGFFPQVIHAHVFSTAKIPSALAKVLRVPLVVTEHWTALCREGVLSRERLDSAKQVYEQSTMVLPVCDYLRRCIETNTGARFKSSIIFNAVDTKIFFYDGRNRKKQIVTVARLESAKDIPTLLRSIALLKDTSVSLKIVGRGDAKPFVALSKEMGIIEQVEFLGEQTKPVIAELMRESSVFALSSLWENSPCVIGEALCCGLPVVATSVGGIPELLTQSDGRLVPPSQPEAMAKALKEILENPQQFSSWNIAERARPRFSHEAIGAQLDEVYCRAVND
jgi:glycosyltransferase involved in cell wall biosynthesis